MMRLLPESLARWIARLVGRRGDRMRAHAHHAAPASGSMLDCESVMRQLWDYLDGELTAERMEQIRGHVDLCRRCYPQYEFERSFLDMLATRRRMHSNPERLRSQLLAALRERGLSGV